VFPCLMAWRNNKHHMEYGLIKEGEREKVRVRECDTGSQTTEVCAVKVQVTTRIEVLRTFLSFSSAVFSFFSHFLLLRCICFDTIRRLMSSSSNETLLPMMLAQRLSFQDIVHKNRITRKGSNPV
jgi:hypothetical protein